jgi:hypothetical protein
MQVNYPSRMIGKPEVILKKHIFIEKSDKAEYKIKIIIYPCLIKYYNTI